MTDLVCSIILLIELLTLDFCNVSVIDLYVSFLLIIYLTVGGDSSEITESNKFDGQVLSSQGFLSLTGKKAEK